MPDRRYDSIVIGGGLLGGAAAYALSRSKKNSTLLLDARTKGHAEGSSHGHSRIVRTVASESQQFAEMADESFRRMLGMNRPDRFVAGPVDALFMSFVESDSFAELARKNASRVLRDSEIFENWGIRLPKSAVGIEDKRSAGILDPAALMSVFFEEIGAENIRWEIPVTSWDADAAGVTVVLASGEKYSAGKLVLAAGAWLPGLLACGTVDPEVAERLSRMSVERIPLYYFDYPAEIPPVILVTLKDACLDMYAMPEFDPPITFATKKPRYLKVGFHQGAKAKTPQGVDRSVYPDEERHAAEYMRQHLGLNLSLHHTGLCLYAMPPDLQNPGDAANYDERPLLGELPRTPSVFLAAYGSGICAKHALVMGDQICALLEGRSPSYDLQEFDPARRLRLA